MVKPKGRLLVTFAAMACVCSFTVYSSLAYMTDGGSHVNDFSTAKFKIELTEPQWNTSDLDNDGVPAGGHDLYQNETRAKDPTVTNHSTVPAWIFLEVEVPVFYGRYAEGQKTMSKELFTYDVSSDWKLLHSGSKILSAGEKFGASRYLYGYKYKVDPGKKTTPLFTNVRFADLVEGELADTHKINMGLQAYGIQSMGVPDLNYAYSVFDWDQPNMEADPNDGNRK